MLQITNGAVQARARVLVVAFLAQEEPYGRRTALNASIYSRSYGMGCSKYDDLKKGEKDL